MIDRNNFYLGKTMPYNAITRYPWSQYIGMNHCFSKHRVWGTSWFFLTFWYEKNAFEVIWNNHGLDIEHAGGAAYIGIGCQWSLEHNLNDIICLRTEMLEIPVFLRHLENEKMSEKQMSITWKSTIKSKIHVNFGLHSMILSKYRCYQGR